MAWQQNYQPLFVVLLLLLISDAVAKAHLSSMYQYDGDLGGELLQNDDAQDTVYAFNYDDYDQSVSDARVEWGEKPTEDYSDGKLGKRLNEGVQSKSPSRTRVSKLVQKQPLSLSLSCNDERTNFSLSTVSQGGESRGFIPADILAACGVVKKKSSQDALFPIKDCDVTLSYGYCSTRMKYEEDGRLAEITLPCTAHYPGQSSADDTPLNGLSRSDLLQSDSPSGAPHEYKCNIPNWDTSTSQTSSLPDSDNSDSTGPSFDLHHRQNCHFNPAQRIPCPSTGFPPKCSPGCCVDHGVCYYPMDECTLDKQFVFVVQKPTDYNLDLRKLRAGDCQPAISTSTFAVFIFPVTACGTVSYETTGMTVYTVEVSTIISTSIPVFGGRISREQQYRLVLKCQYHKGQGSGLSNLLATGYMVKNPQYPMVQSEGIFRMVLRIAKDGTYTDFYPHNSPPLDIVLGKPVFLEAKLISPVPKSHAMLRLIDCIAYPRSATKALLLLIDGCPNPEDPFGVIIHKVADNDQIRHFEAKAFQFIIAPHKYLKEEIYFLCSMELCFPKEKVCDPGCF